MTRETLNAYEGQNNVTRITNDNGSVSHLTQSIGFIDEAYATGATSLNTVENEKRHALFLFNAEGAEVGRYYLTKGIQGKTPQELASMKHNLCIFKSFNPETKAWVPCVAESKQENLSKSAVTF